MKNVVLARSLAFTLVLLPAGTAFTQVPTSKASSEATTSTPAAYVYVQTSKGIEVYSASSSGALAKVSGSPFAASGQMGGINGSYLVSVGTDYLHTYPIKSNGAVGSQASEINTQSYAGAACGTNSGGSLFDHTGKYLYVLLTGSTTDECSALQSYKINSSGQLTYLGDAVTDNSYHGMTLPEGVNTISGSDTLAYGVWGDVYTDEFSAFTRNSNGELLINTNFKQTGPTPDPAGTDDSYWPLAVAADPTNHLAVLMNEPFTNSPPPQLASFTINSNGSITSTNTYANMPAPSIQVNTMNMSPSGKQLAVAGNGIEIYNFNGASPLTLASSLSLPSRDFGTLAWDKSNHLYALDYETGGLYVYTIGATSIKEVGSSVTVPDAAKQNTQYPLIVVPK